MSEHHKFLGICSFVQAGNGPSLEKKGDGDRRELTVKVGREESAEAVADSATELELSSLRTFWASSATAP